MPALLLPLLGRSSRGPFPRTPDSPHTVDVDPHWYPGQPEMADLEPDKVPTVLSKLQKWGGYPSVGEPVGASKFLPMKTPLGLSILSHWSLPAPPLHVLSLPTLFSDQAAQQRSIGLILDLANHDCLYSEDIPAGVLYSHIQLVAKELPSPEFVAAVRKVANDFWEQHPGQYIAIHCAYGFNRTGFVVCCYLIEQLGMAVDDALAAFALSRPPGVRHEKFRDELYRRYHQPPPPHAAPPPAQQHPTAAGDAAAGAASSSCSPSRRPDVAALLTSAPSALEGSDLYALMDDNSSFGCSPAAWDAADGSFGSFGAPTPARVAFSRQMAAAADGVPPSWAAGGRLGSDGVAAQLAFGSPTVGQPPAAQARLASATGPSGSGAGVGVGGVVEGGGAPAGREATAAAFAEVHSAALRLSADGDGTADNDSLGVNDRVLLASLSVERRRLTASGLKPREVNDVLLSPSAAAAAAGRPHPSPSASPRPGLAQIDWGLPAGGGAAAAAVVVVGSCP